ILVVIGEMTTRLPERRDDLRHLEPKCSLRVRQRSPVALRVAFRAFGRVRPNLDALACKRCTVARATHGASHPETTATDPSHDRRAGAVIIGPAPHGGGRRKSLRADRY